MQSRKAKRKQTREDKKREKFKRQCRETNEVAKANSYVPSNKKATERSKKSRIGTRPQEITNKFHEFIAEEANARAASSSAEDKEIKALEAKLGLGSSSASKSASALKKLKKEFAKDGLGEDFADFLSELDTITEVVKNRPNVAKPTEAQMEIAKIKIKINASGNNSNGNDNLEMDEATRREMEMLQAEDAEFLKGLDELPTDESESESEDLTQFYSEDEDSDDNDVAQANALRNQQLSAVEIDEIGESRLDLETKSKSKLEEGDVNGSDVKSAIEESTAVDESLRIEEDIYGRPVIRTRDGTKPPSTYLPPHLRRKAQSEADTITVTDKVKPLHMDEQAMRELTRRINGQLNRISESNMESIALEMERIYRDNGRSLVNGILFDKLLQTTCHPRQVMASLIKVCSALVAALYHSVGSEVGGFFVEKLTRKLVESVAEEIKLIELNQSKLEDNTEDESSRTSKVPVNLMLFVMMLYNFGVVHCSLVYDLFRSFVQSFSTTDIELIHQLLKIGGAQLRADDPDALRQMVAAVQQKVGEVHHTIDKTQPPERIGFILDLIYDLNKSSKQAKRRTESASGGVLDLAPLKKWLGRVKTRCGNANNPLRVSLQELLHADEDGRWWIVGGTWVGFQQKLASHDVNDDENAVETNRLLQLAEKQRMNTDVRKKIFVALMGANDCFDAYERLMQLHLKEKQEREIVRVLLRCGGQENRFNKFYLALAEKLCEMDSRYKFTFQLAFWDIFKQMETLKPRTLFNQAQILAGLVLRGHLSLSCLKVLDFTQLEEKSILFLRVIMEEILKVESEFEMAQVFHRLLQTKKAQLTIDGLAVFFHQHLTSFCNEPDQKVQTLLKRRVKSVKSLLDQLAKSAALADREAKY